MYCRHCGKEIADTDATCPHCKRDQFEYIPVASMKREYEKGELPDRSELPPDDFDLKVVEPEPVKQKEWIPTQPKRERWRMPSLRRIMMNLVIALLAVVGIVGIFLPFYELDAVMSPGEISLSDLIQSGIAYYKDQPVDSISIIESFKQLVNLYAGNTKAWYIGGIFLALIPAFLGLTMVGTFLSALRFQYKRQTGLRCLIIHSLIAGALFYFGGREMGVWLNFFANAGAGYWLIFSSLIAISVLQIFDYPEERR